VGSVDIYGFYVEEERGRGLKYLRNSSRKRELEAGGGGYFYIRTNQPASEMEDFLVRC
jgi:hypothetical protein